LSSLYILNMNPLSDEYLVNIFSHSVCCPFILNCFFFCAQLLKIFLLIYSHVHTLFGPFLPPSPLASRQNLFCPHL
jgi:hypothetical protein